MERVAESWEMSTHKDGESIVGELKVDDIAQIKVTDKTFKSIIVVDGEGKISGCDYRINFTKGDSIFIPHKTIVLKL